MGSTSRMSAQERKLSIIEAAKPLFAKSGFNGTSVRHIAKAANVSEALLYKHFPSKEAMYKEILAYTGKISSLAVNEFNQLEPGTETLVVMLYSMVQMIMFEVPGRGDEQKKHERLLFYSLLEDVSYAETVFENILNNWRETAIESYETAVRAGDIIELNIAPQNRFWFVHHLAMALNLCHLSGKSAFEYDVTMEELAEDATLFALRGIGLTDAAIKEHFKPKKLKIFFKGLFA